MARSLERPIVYDEAFITSLVRYGESDCIVRLFSRTEGRMVAFFKSGLAIKKKRGAIQAPSLARVGYIPGHEGRMTRLCSCDLDPNSYLWASSLKLFAYGNYLAELTEKLLPEEEPASEVFELLHEALLACGKWGAKAWILRAFELKLLEYLGYLPEFPEYTFTSIFYDPVACHFANEQQAFSFEFSSEALNTASTMLKAPFASITSQDEQLLTTIGRIFYSRLRLMGMLPLKSTAFFRELSRTSPSIHSIEA